MGEAHLTIAVIDEDRIRAAMMEDGLREAGHDRVVHITDMTDVVGQLLDIAPDVIIIDLASPNRDVLEQMFQVSRTVERPIAMFVDQSDRSMMEAAMDAGVSAYIVDGLKKERVAGIVELSISRFNAFSRLKKELADTRTQLAERKLIERAKGILMSRRGLSESEAFSMLRRTAMNEKKRLVQVAESVLMAASLLGTDEKSSQGTADDE